MKFCTRRFRGNVLDVAASAIAIQIDALPAADERVIKGLRDNVWMIDWSAPVLVHAWLGSLYRNGDQELIGWIELDPAVRRPRDNGSRDVEILLETGTAEPGPALDAHVDACAARIRSALDHLSGLKRYVLDYGPPGWVRYYAAQPGPSLLDRLFLEGLRVSGKLLVSLDFDFGDLDLVTVQLNHSGTGEEVSLHA